MSSLTKQFVITQSVKNVSSIADGGEHVTPSEIHYGTEWYMRIKRDNGFMSFGLYCPMTGKTTNWSIVADIRVELMPLTGMWKSVECECKIAKSPSLISEVLRSTIMPWGRMMTNYVVDDALMIEVFVTIKSMTGFERPYNLRSFDESMEEFSDVVLLVGEKKFYVLRKYLAAQSKYFKALLLGSFEEGKSSEVTLTSIDPNDFQFFLEVLYGDSAINDLTVEGILHIADMYDTPMVVRKCEEFLIKGTKLPAKKKLQMAFRYKMENFMRNYYAELGN
ncbi:BTB domain-containing protein [Caenorhabditis elegans]|uniref:BTB domain-containing protein n=2 Tax=Caenorhabditis elegans TaxID=6239 RepID=A0A131MBE3_CAEEL|nr:BTB domain-containing protein [Caenorhabditis elegans]CZR14470.1 BTB domain-containing protein [Caenorhabditis elegans]|eukprot:NP_001309554.1 SKN-1 Dependent Zygotic transcript [Caenorhabditis elegans]